MVQYAGEEKYPKRMQVTFLGAKFTQTLSSEHPKMGGKEKQVINLHHIAMLQH